MVQRVFQALSDENRRQILKLLKSGSMSAGEIAEHLPIGKAALSHHFGILKVAELVRCEKRGQSRVYSINTTAMEDLAGWVLELTGPIKSKSKRATSK